MLFSDRTNKTLGKGRQALAGSVATVALIAIVGVAGAQAADPSTTGSQDQVAAAAAAPAAKDDSLTMYGITLYGTVDLAAGYQRHGENLNANFYPGVDELVSKNGNKPHVGLLPSGLSQSKIGIKGTEEFAPGYSAVFNFETGFNPQSLHLADAVKSLQSNNGNTRLQNQSSNGDGSRAGQIFNSVAFAGVKSDLPGQVTYGRHNSLELDAVNAYDPQGGSYAFSVVGFSGATAGVGNTEDTRLDDSFKYSNKFGPIRVGAEYQLGGPEYQIGDAPGISGHGEQFDLGVDYKGLSADALYAYKKNAISLGTLTPTATTIPNSLSATVSDNQSESLMVKYKLGQAKLMAGYEHIMFANPTGDIPTIGDHGLGDYTFGKVTSNAYVNNKILQSMWTGVKYSVTPSLDVNAAYYHYIQNSYNVTKCSSDVTSSKCSGTLNALSLSAVYSINKHFDVYGGAMWSEVLGGLKNGYLYGTNIDPTVGVRVQF